MDTSRSLSQKAKTIALYLIEFYTETVERPSDRNHKTFIPSIFPIFIKQTRTGVACIGRFYWLILSLSEPPMQSFHGDRTSTTMIRVSCAARVKWVPVQSSTAYKIKDSNYIPEKQHIR